MFIRNYLLNIKSNINHNLEPLDKFIEKLKKEYILNEKRIDISILNKLTDHNLANDVHYYNFINSFHFNYYIYYSSTCFFSDQ